MNIKMIILGISMFVVLYYLYKFLIGNQIVKSKNLRYDTTITPYSYSSLLVPNATRYCYYIWIHANVIDASMANIFTVTDKISSSADTKRTLFSLDIVNNTDLQVSVLIKNAGGGTKMNSFVINNNFPIQSWEQVIISFDNMNMDTYFNGKFIKSIQFNTSSIGMPVQTSENASIDFGKGNPKPDIDIRLFNRYEYSMDPQTAWNSYKNDKNVSDGSSINYGLNLNLSTNNKLQSIPIF